MPILTCSSTTGMLSVRPVASVRPPAKMSSWARVCPPATLVCAAVPVAIPAARTASVTVAPVAAVVVAPPVAVPPVHPCWRQDAARSSMS